MNAKMKSGLFLQLFAALVAGSLLLGACAPAAAQVSRPSAAPTSAPIATKVPTSAPTRASVLSGSTAALSFALNAGSLATGAHTETVPAVSASANGPYWELLPEYALTTLQGYPIGSHIVKPQLFIYPLQELGKVNEGAGKIAASLQTLLHSPQDTQYMPFMPLYNAQQVLHTHVKALDFKGGKGLRYLTQFDQAYLPINNNELIYTFQGVTGDGKYYVAAVLPVSHPSLPADGKVTGKEPPEFTSDFPGYLANMVKTLEKLADNSFAPDLTQLDAMMSSLEIQ
jgi:hypothetical protein